MKAMTAPRQEARPRRKLPRQKYIFPFSKHKEVLFQIFSLQIVLLTIANKKILVFPKLWFYKQFDMCQGYERPCRAVPCHLS